MLGIVANMDHTAVFLTQTHDLTLASESSKQALSAVIAWFTACGQASPEYGRDVISSSTAYTRSDGLRAYALDSISNSQSYATYSQKQLKKLQGRFFRFGSLFRVHGRR